LRFEFETSMGVSAEVVENKFRKELAPRARFELATLRLTGECSKNLNAVSGVAYEKSGAIFPSLPAPNVAPKFRAICTELCLIVEQDSSVEAEAEEK
jgi:hypothetical protein